MIYRGDLLRQVEALGGLRGRLRDALHGVPQARQGREEKASQEIRRRAQDGARRALLKANKERATASDRFGGAGQDELQALAEKHEGLNLG